METLNMRNLMKRPGVLLLGLVLLVGLAALGWYLGSPLFINNEVTEAFPFELPVAAEIAQMPADDLAQLEADFLAAVPDEGAVESLSPETRAAVEEKVMEAAALMPDHEMVEAMPEGAGPVIVSAGEFAGADSFHQGSGSASIYALPDGSTVLRLQNFEVTNGPDLHVLLSSHPNPSSRADVMQSYIDLGKLKGNLGDQNYTLPAGTDVTLYQSVVIYCQPFHVLFASAPLSPGG
jgi:hypothetical protein